MSWLPQLHALPICLSVTYYGCVSLKILCRRCGSNFRRPSLRKKDTWITIMKGASGRQTNLVESAGVSQGGVWGFALTVLIAIKTRTHTLLAGFMQRGNALAISVKKNPSSEDQDGCLSARFCQWFGRSTRADRIPGAC
eukprot:1161815-Pelagomonas_calceolata.AAC.1